MITTALVLLLRTSLVLIATLVAGVLVRRSPAARLAIYRLGIVATFAVVLASPWLRTRSNPVVPVTWSPSQPVMATRSVPKSVAPKASARSEKPVSLPASDRSDTSDPADLPATINPNALVVGLWALGVLILSAFLALGYRSLVKIHRPCVSVDDPSITTLVDKIARNAGVRTPAIVEGDTVGNPFVAGVLRPAIYLPTGWRTSVDPEALKAVLQHEVAHIAGGDLRWGLLYRLARIVLWPQPLLWLLDRPMTAASEELCDRHVLAAGFQDVQYAQCLLDLRRSTRPCPALGIGAVSKRTSLSKRIEAILHAPQTLKLRLSRSAILSIGLLAAVLTVGSVFLIAKPSQQSAVTDPYAGWIVNPYEGRIKVLTENGKPVNEARAWLQFLGDSLPATTRSLSVSNGVVTLDPGDAPKGTRAVLIVKAEKYGLGFCSLWPMPKRITEIRLPNPVRVTGRLLLPDRTPAVDVPVTTKFLIRMHENPRHIEWAIIDPVMNVCLEGRTDSSGRFAIDGFPPSWKTRLDVVDDRFAQIRTTEDVTLTSKRTVQAKDITLELAAAFDGRIMRDGKPVAGIKVEAQSNNADLNKGGSGGDAMTDANGRYTIRRLPSGVYDIAVDLQGRDETAVAHEGIKVSAGQTVTGLDFALIPGAIIEGRVIDEDGKPIPKTSVGIYGPAHPESSAWVQMAPTDKDGRYRTHVPAGKQRVYVMDSRFDHDTKVVTVKDGTTTTVDLRVKPRDPEPTPQPQVQAAPNAGPTKIVFPNGTVFRFLHLATWSKANGYSAWDVAGKSVTVKDERETLYMKNYVVSDPTAQGRWVAAVYEVIDRQPDPNMGPNPDLSIPNVSWRVGADLSYNAGKRKYIRAWVIPTEMPHSSMSLSVSSGRYSLYGQESLGGNGKLSPRSLAKTDVLAGWEENGKPVKLAYVQWVMPKGESTDWTYRVTAIWSDGHNDSNNTQSYDRGIGYAGFKARPNKKIVALKVERRRVWHGTIQNVALTPFHP